MGEKKIKKPRKDAKDAFFIRRCRRGRRGFFFCICDHLRHLRMIFPFSFNSRFFLLTEAYDSCTSICMRTTLNIDDQIMAQASRLTGVGEKTKLVHIGLQSLIEQESARRLAKLGGTEPGLKPISRRRSS